MVVLEQSHDVAALFRPDRNLQQHVAVSERLVVDLQGFPVVAEPLKGAHDAASQSVVAAMLIQDGRSPLTAQNLHRCDIHPGRFEFAGDGGDLRLIGQQAYHVVDGPVMEVVDIDLGLVYDAAPSRGAAAVIIARLAVVSRGVIVSFRSAIVLVYLARFWCRPGQ